MYWGQNSHGTTSPGENQLPLDEYCDKEAGDVLVLSFLSEFNADGLHPPILNLANSCLTTFDNSTLLHCPNIGKAIEKCQKRGKAVILSLGGASGAYGFTSEVQAERYADKIWDMFLGGTAQYRPFNGAVLDGIDLDIEGGSSIGYVRFVQRLRERFIESPGRRFYVTAAPQCPYPDFYSGPILDNAYLDMVFVQFYNNYCGVDKPNWFNFEQWHEWATTVSANKDVRVYLGVPGSPLAASTGYMPLDRLEELVNATRANFNTFGGIMVWDASQADTNTVTRDATFVDLAKRLLDSDKKCTDGSFQTEAAHPDSNEESTAHAKTLREKKNTGSKVADRALPKSLGTSSSTTSSPIPDLYNYKLAKIGDKTAALISGKNMVTDVARNTAGKITDISQQSDQICSRKVSGMPLMQINRVATGSISNYGEGIEPESDSSAITNSADSEDSPVEEVAENTGLANDMVKVSSEGSETDSTEPQETVEDSANDSTETTPEDNNETTTMETTKLLFATITKTRKVYIVTQHVTKRVRKPPGNGGLNSLTDYSTTTTNKTVSIVTPTFPLPIARCPRADQPCIGAGFACNGYEFGQCVNNRWLMRPCSTDRVTSCFNAGPDLVACDFSKGRSLQVCDDILSPLPYGRFASNVLFLRASDQGRALNTPVYPVPSGPVSTTTHVKKKKKDDDESNSDSEDEDNDYIYNKYGEKQKKTVTPTATDMELIKQSSGVNLIDDHNRREDPAMLMVKDPADYFGPDGHVRVVAGNVVDDLRKHNKFGTANELYDENPPVDDPEEADEYSDNQGFMRKRDLGAWDEIQQFAASSAPQRSLPTAPASECSAHAGALSKRDVSDITGESVSMAHIGKKPWRSQVEDFYTIYALYSAFSGISNDMIRQQFERVITDHIDGDFLVPPSMMSLAGRPLLARFTFVPLRGEDDDFKHYLSKDGQVEEDILVTVRMLTNIPIPKRWRVALPLPLNATMLHTSRGLFYSGDRVSAEVKSMYMQRVAFYNDNIRLNTNKKQSGLEFQRFDDLAAGHSSNATDAANREFTDGPNYDSIRRNLISPSVMMQILHKRPDAPPEFLDEPVPNDPAGRLYEVRSDPDNEKSKNMAISFIIRVKTHAEPGRRVISTLPHPILSFISTY
ncbi:Chitinase 2 [Kickxella alabastrina]|uniref:Chitinase 2 n=1 Tax=Kickxella alabastrina TaxID=61397 RepID=A0ACC1ILB3_9FUNG|nr:Chitinase 2 [Kickxella alabastrina]